MAIKLPLNKKEQKQGDKLNNTVYNRTMFETRHHNCKSLLCIKCDTKQGNSLFWETTLTLKLRHFPGRMLWLHCSYVVHP